MPCWWPEPAARSSREAAGQAVGGRLLSIVAAAALAPVVALLGQSPGPAAPSQDVHPHASSTFVRFEHSSRAFALEHPDDWKAHERGDRVNVGADDGLVATARGFRTIYGVIVQIMDDPLAGQPERSPEASARAMVEAVLKRNPHQAVVTPVRADGSLSGAPAFSAVLQGTSPVTGHGERAEIVCRQYGPSKIFSLILVSPVDAHQMLQSALRRVRDSVRLAEPPGQ